MIRKVTRGSEQLSKHWAPFKVLRQRYAGTRFEEQRQLHLPQKHKATVPDSTLREELNNLEEQADNAKARELFWKPLNVKYAAGRNAESWAANPHPAGGRQSHHPRRDLRHAHGNAHARIRPRRHLRTPTVLRWPWSMPRGTSATTPPTATKGTPPAPTGPGSKPSTHRPQENLPIRRASVPRSPNTSKQVGVSVSYATSQQTRA